MTTIHLNQLIDLDTWHCYGDVRSAVATTISVLEHKGHSSGVRFTVQTNLNTQMFRLEWSNIPCWPREILTDPEKCFEISAVCISSLLVLQLTDYRFFFSWSRTLKSPIYLNKVNSFENARTMLEVSSLMEGNMDDVYRSYIAQKENYIKTKRKDSASIFSVINFQQPACLFSDLDDELSTESFISPIETFSRLILRLNEGKIEIVGQKEDGSVIYSDGLTKMENGLFIIQESKWTPVLKELECLINKKNLREQELQAFLEFYPDLILGDEYCRFIPQATIVNDDGHNWRADFVLIPHNQFDFAKILELKLPASKISLQSKAGHHNYSKQMVEAIRQLQDYHQAFDSLTISQKFKEKYQTNVFKPSLQLIIGRRNSIQNPKDLLTLQNRHQIKITDWDSLHETLTRKYR